MKKTIILLFLTLCLKFITSAQQYIPMLGNSNRWYIYQDTIIGHTKYYDIHDNYIYSIFTYGDSVVNGITYKKISGKGFGTDKINGLIREDTSKRSIYFLKTGDSLTNEFTLYNFNINVGDSLKLYDINGVCYPKWYHVDSIKNAKLYENYYNGVLYDTSFRRIFFLSCSSHCSNPIYYVEGIGSLYNFRYPYYSPVLLSLTKLSCYSKDNINIFHTNPVYWGIDFDECSEHYINIKNTKLNNNIEIFPNPTNQLITIKYNIESVTSIEIDVIDDLGKTYPLFNSPSYDGTFERAFDLKKYFISSQILFLRIRTGERIEFYKIILI